MFKKYLKYKLKYINNKNNFQSNMFGGNQLETNQLGHYLLDNKKEIFCIGDIHGDYDILIKILKDINCINNKEEWIGKNKYVVFNGDLVDRGGRNSEKLGCTNNQCSDSDYRVIKKLLEFKKESQKYDSDIILVMGNHELMLFQGNTSYNIMDSSYQEKFVRSPADSVVKEYVDNCVVIAFINNLVFVHGSICAELFNIKCLEKENDPFSFINKEVRKWLKKENYKTPCLDILLSYKTLFQKSLSPLWNRDFGRDFDCKILEQVLNTIKQKYNKHKIFNTFDYNNLVMIIGHTVQDEINSKCNNQIFRIDNALSRAFHSKSKKQHVLQLLKFKKSNKDKHFIDYEILPKKKNNLFIKDLNKF